MFNNQDIYPDSVPPAYLGDSWDTGIQLKYILSQTSSVVQQTSSFRKYKQDNPVIEQAQNLIFGQSLEYYFYTSPTEYETSLISLQSAVTDFIVQQNSIVLNQSALEPSVLNTSALLNLFNAENVISSINSALGYITNYIQALDTDTNKIANIVFGVVVVCYVHLLSVCKKAKRTLASRSRVLPSYS